MTPQTIPTDVIAVLCTTPNQEVASNLANTIVQERLAACVNIISGITSVYHWNDSLCHDQEVLLVIKTTSQVFPSLRQRVLSLHPYEVPELIALPVTAGSRPYLTWIQNNTK